MRIAHVSLFGPEKGQCQGIVNKLALYARSAIDNEIAIDFHAIFMAHNQPCDENEYPHLVIHKVKGTSLLARKRQIEIVNALLTQYDKLILRYPGFDPVCVTFLSHTSRIILEHHAKEGPFLRSIKDIRWPFEWMFGGSWIRCFHAITAVTPEILEYQIKRSRFQGKQAYYPNTISVDAYHVSDGPIYSDSDGAIKLGMVFSKNYQWSGINKIIDALNKASKHNIELHIAGMCDISLKRDIKHSDSVVYHGVLPIEKLDCFYQKIHLGIGSFSLQKAGGISQATPLKIREFLAHGIPVVYPYDDPALPNDFPFKLQIPVFDIDKIVKFFFSIRGISRETVHTTARPYIDSGPMLKHLYEFCTV